MAWWVLLLLGVVAVAHCGRLHKATLRPLEPHGVLGAWCYSDWAYTHRSELRAILEMPWLHELTVGGA